jgi:phosphoribosylformylglycinamidine (FGAM) synthase PurS component
VTRAIAIGLKIPDNTAYTALVALRRLGVAVEAVERREIFFFEDDGDVAALVRRVKADETIFNPNKHRLEVLDEPAPRPGELWIEPICGPSTKAVLSRVEGRAAAVAWRLAGARGLPASPQMLAAAADRLLCNPAIDRARV